MLASFFTNAQAVKQCLNQDWEIVVSFVPTEVLVVHQSKIKSVNDIHFRIPGAKDKPKFSYEAECMSSPSRVFISFIQSSIFALI